MTLRLGVIHAMEGLYHASNRSGVRGGKPQNEHMFSGLPPKRTSDLCINETPRRRVSVGGVGWTNRVSDVSGALGSSCRQSNIGQAGNLDLKVRPVVGPAA